MALVNLNRESGPPYFTDDETVSSLLEAIARARPDHVYLRWDGGKLTCAGLEQESGRLAASIASLGVKPGERVAVMLGHHLDHVLVFFALIRLGAVLVPVNTALRGPSLCYQLGHSQPALVIADREFAEVLDEPVATARIARVLWRDGPGDFTGNGRIKVGPAGDHPPEVAFRWDDLRIILYTSGTTGAPKGVQMSDRMLLASALGSIWISGVEPGDTLHFWDPIYHVFGAEVLVLALMVPVTLYMV
ncbi:MAG: acyl--CoA ligase, partial [Mesorhizobium sp.]